MESLAWKKKVWNRCICINVQSMKYEKDYEFKQGMCGPNQDNLILKNVPLSLIITWIILDYVLWPICQVHFHLPLMFVV